MGSLAGRWTRRVLAIGPWLVLPAVAIVIAARWEAWPRVYPVHWGLLQGADRFTELSTRSVASPLLVAVALLAWLELVRAHILRHADPAFDGGRSLRIVHCTARNPPPDGWLYVPRAIGVGFAISRGHPAALRAWILVLGPPLAILALSRLFLA